MVGEIAIGSNYDEDVQTGLLFIVCTLSALFLNGCQNYDDQFDDLTAQITALSTTVAGLNQLESDIESLSTKINAVRSAYEVNEFDTTALDEMNDTLNAIDTANILTEQDVDAAATAVADIQEIFNEFMRTEYITTVMYYVGEQSDLSKLNVSRDTIDENLAGIVGINGDQFTVINIINGNVPNSVEEVQTDDNVSMTSNATVNGNVPNSDEGGQAGNNESTTDADSDTETAGQNQKLLIETDRKTLLTTLPLTNLTMDMTLTNDQGVTSDYEPNTIPKAGDTLILSIIDSVRSDSEDIMSRLPIQIESSAPNASLVDNEDGTYTLTFSDSSEYAASETTITAYISVNDLTNRGVSLAYINTLQPDDEKIIISEETVTLKNTGSTKGIDNNTSPATNPSYIIGYKDSRYENGLIVNNYQNGKFVDATVNTPIEGSPAFEVLN